MSLSPHPRSEQNAPACPAISVRAWHSDMPRPGFYLQHSVSHDQLTRMLQGSWSGHRRLDLALRALCSVAGGSLSVDDPVVAQPSARLLGEAAWVWSNQDRKVLFGGSVVLLVWTDGHIRIPLAFRVWQKGGASQYDLALELLSSARHRLRCQPAFVLFDSWYPSKKLLKRLRDSGWCCFMPGGVCDGGT
jgi:Transposase DDE domain